MTKGNLVAVYSAKGGVGKTTFAINLAGALSNHNKKVLIVDLDFYSGGIALSLDKIPKKTIYNFSKDMNKEVEINKYITKYNNNIDFISCPRSIEEANSIDFKVVEQLIFKASLLYDIVLFDLSHIYSDVNSKLLKIVNNLLYIVTNDPVDLKNTANMLPILSPNKSKIKVILNYSIHYDRDYYLLYDIKNIINYHIDYILSARFHNPDIDSVTLKGEIMTINNTKLPDSKIFNLIVKSITSENN